MYEITQADLDSIWPIARSMALGNGKWSSDDLYQEGALAMIRFADRYRPQPGIPFAAAARARVRGAMQDFLRRKAGAVRGRETTMLSLDYEGEGGEGRSMLDSLADETDTEPTLDLDGLTPCEREVAHARFLRPHPESIASLAARLRKTEDHIRRCQMRVMRKLRAAAAMH